MLETAREVEDTNFVVFTKKFNIVRQNLQAINAPNLRILLSAWHNETPEQEALLLDTIRETRPMIERVAVSWVDNDPRVSTLGQGVYKCTNYCPSCFQCWIGGGDVLLHKH
jgi:hypothetical protein